MGASYFPMEVAANKNNVQHKVILIISSMFMILEEYQKQNVNK